MSEYWAKASVYCYDIFSYKYNLQGKTYVKKQLVLNWKYYLRFWLFRFRNDFNSWICIWKNIYNVLIHLYKTLWKYFDTNVKQFHKLSILVTWMVIGEEISYPTETLCEMRHTKIHSSSSDKSFSKLLLITLYP